MMVNSGLSGGLYIIYMVGGFSHLEKNMKVNGHDYPIYAMDNKKWLKPPTRL